MASRIWSVPSWNQRRTHNRNKVTRKQIQPPLYLKVLGYQSEREEVIWNTKRHQTHSEGLHGGQVEKGQVIQGLGQRESNYLQNSNDTKIPARVWSPSKILWKQGCHPVFGDLLKTEVFIFHSTPKQNMDNQISIWIGNFQSIKELHKFKQVKLTNKNSFFFIWLVRDHKLSKPIRITN